LSVIYEMNLLSIVYDWTVFVKYKQKCYSVYFAKKSLKLNKTLKNESETNG
jgi:hypothetical protein